MITELTGGELTAGSLGTIQVTHRDGLVAAFHVEGADTPQKVLDQVVGLLMWDCDDEDPDGADLVVWQAGRVGAVIRRSADGTLETTLYGDLGAPGLRERLRALARDRGRVD